MILKKIINIVLWSFNHKYRQDQDSALEQNIKTRRLLAKNSFYLRLDMNYELVFHKISYEEYCMFQFPFIKSKERVEYISDAMRFEILLPYKSPDTLRYYRNKSDTYAFYKEYFGREALLVNMECRKGAIIDFLSRHPDIVVKQETSSEGKGVQFYHCNTSQESYNIVYNLYRGIILGNSYLIEEAIVQSQEMNRLNPSSVNTVRFVVMKGIKSAYSIENLYAIVRMGVDGSKLDNLTAGGICAAIDLKTGIIITDAYKYTGETYKMHPNTNETIKGFQIPEWSELLDTVKTASSKIVETRIIGWDMAHTPSGWVVVEANSLPSFHGYQVCNKKGIRKLLLDLCILKKEQ